MFFDDPIFLDHDAVDDLMADTEQHRICWMHHETLSDAKIARMFAAYAGQGAPEREAWTAMAWVAAGRQEDAFYLLFKWYEDFFGPPERADLYYVERDTSEGGAWVRQLRMDRIWEADPRGLDLCNALWSRISENAAWYFGDSDFDQSSLRPLLRLLEDSRGQELEAFDWYLGKRSDGEKAAQCHTVAANFLSLATVTEIAQTLVQRDGGGRSHLPHRELYEILNRLPTGAAVEQLYDLSVAFRVLADQFCPGPCYGPVFTRNQARTMTDLTHRGDLTWVRLGGQGCKKMLRELYCRCDPRTAWDVCHRWQGDLYFTVLQRPTIRGLHRGVYLLSRFEDQRGMDVTDLFWIQHLDRGVVHLCGGDFFGALLDDLLSQSCTEISLHGGRRRGEDLPAVYSVLLKEAFDKLERGDFHRRGSQLDRIY